VCSDPSCNHGWSAYSTSKPTWRPRPRRKPVRESVADRDAAYRWEAQCLGDLENGLRLGPVTVTSVQDAAAVIQAVTTYVADLWQRHAGQYRALHQSVPTVDIRFHWHQQRGGGKALMRSHLISIDHRCCGKTWICHELAHLLTPYAGHSQPWRDAVAAIWSREYWCSRGYATAEAERLGLDLGRAVTAMVEFAQP
jgi:hypothetical protein